MIAVPSLATQGSSKGVEVAGRILRLTSLKGSKPSAKEANALIQGVKNAQSLGVVFKGSGIETYGSSKVSMLAISSVFDDLVEQDFLSNVEAMTLSRALFGYPDEAFIPQGMGVAALFGAVGLGPISLVVGGMAYALDKTRYTIQKWTESTMTSVEALDALGRLDPGAADYTAEAILKAQENYAEKYLTPLIESFRNGFWRGAKVAVEAIVRGAQGVVSLIVPPWMQVGLGVGALVYLFNKYKV